MARKPSLQPKIWVRLSISVLSIGVLALAGTASATPNQEGTKSEVAARTPESQVSQVKAPARLNLRKGGVLQFGSPVSFIDEAEPNDTAATAQPLATTPVRVRSKLFRAPFTAGIDVDYYSVTAAAGDRLYAATMTNFTNASGDTVIDILASDGTTLIETDDEDGQFNGNASNVGGTVLATAGTYYVRVRQFGTASMGSTIRPYDLYVRVLSGTPTAEVEPNNATPNPLPANGWVRGAIDPAADVDFFSVAANAGDTIVAILDADPERDAPEWNPNLSIGPFNNFVLISNGSGVGGALDDANPSEAHMMVVNTTGTYIIRVIDNVAGGGAPTSTYHLSVSVIPAKPRTCTNYAGTGGPVADPPSAGTDFTITIPDARIIDNLRVNFNATTAQTGDLDVTLISPDGNEVFLWDDAPNTAGAAAPQFNLGLDDEGGIPISLFGIHAGMRYTLEGGATSGRLEYFKGMQAQGTWTLRVRDDLAGNIATVNSVSLDVCEAIAPPTCVVPGPNETTVYTSDFETNDGGFTHTGAQDEWERGLPAFAPIISAHSGVNAWKTDLDNTYNALSNNDLISPDLDLTSVTGRVTLNWWQKFQMETTNFDIYWVEVREVGLPATARKLFEWTGSTMTRSGLGNPAATINQSAGWGRMQADISDFAGRHAEVRFHLETDGSVQFAGVGVDDVSVRACTLISTQAISNAAVTVTDGQGTYFPGEALTYTVVGSNAGPALMVGANVTVDFPTDLTNVSWTCAASNGSACGAASGTGDIDDDVNILSAGNVTYTVTGTVSMTASTPLVVAAGITVPAGWTDPDTANNTATDTDQLIAAASQTLLVDTAGNNVLEPNETAVVEPTWRNTGTAPFALTGTFSNFTGPAGPTYNLPDDQADYGTVAVNTNASCAATGDCYSVNVTAGARPVTHWDSTVDETVDPLGQVKTWTLHLGNSFTDVPTTSGFYRFIETILHRGVTGGCTGTTYCPTNNTNRDAMAVFVLVSKEGASYNPPACVQGSEAFNDVAFDNPFCKWIEELARRGVVSGCGNGAYCPGNPATRDQMAVFVLRTLDPALNPPACVQGSELFGDVPFDNPFCKWIEELARRQVVSGCGNGNYCPTNPVSREQMSVFLTVTFSLTLY